MRTSKLRAVKYQPFFIDTALVNSLTPIPTEGTPTRWEDITDWEGDSGLLYGPPGWNKRSGGPDKRHPLGADEVLGKTLATELAIVV